MKCRSCGATLDLTMSKCPSCGTEVELGRLTGILGVVCRACDAYNDPGAKTCAACGKPLGAAPSEPPASAPSAPPAGTEAPPAPPVRAGAAPPPASGPAAPPAAAKGAVPPPQPGTPVVRSLKGVAPGQPTRFVPSVLRPSPGGKPPEQPIPLQTVCPRCGAPAGAGRFCAQCGQPLGSHGTQVTAKPAPPGPTAADVFGALAPGRASLVLLSGGGLDGATFRLNAESVEAGRSKGAVVFPDDACLAPHHATFLYREGALHVRDERAPGGIYLRLRGLTVPLRAGDHFALGERLFRYAGPLPPAPAQPPDGTTRHGAPRPPAPAIVLEEWLEGGLPGRVFVRGGPSVTIGRAGCAVSLGEDPHLSQSHAEILVDAQGGARLRDLGSSNGTFVRLPAGAERDLRDGDCVRMGREVLRVTVAA